eukprot:TRINITY_DN5987_c0_g1_i6.p1 TRINITY_DN5987_c0_g1~~TRINITY_DN5987_c0_g1_i6.p1  ORF type:complete len:286 (+),score=80.12 TRINITY_DN5987_c0_g1_i6:349-1206(+)
MSEQDETSNRPNEAEDDTEYYDCLKLIVAALLTPTNGLVIKTKTFRLKKHKNCFTGLEAVNCMRQLFDIPTREEAAEIGQKLLDAEFIHAVPQTDVNFKDERNYYSFTILPKYSEEYLESHMDSAVAKVKKHTPKPKRTPPVKTKPQQSPRFGDDGEAPTEKKSTDWRSRTADISRTLRKIRPGTEKHKALENSVLLNQDVAEKVEESTKDSAAGAGSATSVGTESTPGFQFEPLEEENSNEIVFTIDPNVNYPLVKSATIDKLVERLTHEKYPGKCFSIHKLEA